MRTPSRHPRAASDCITCCSASGSTPRHGCSRQRAHKHKRYKKSQNQQTKVCTNHEKRMQKNVQCPRDREPQRPDNVERIHALRRQRARNVARVDAVHADSKRSHRPRDERPRARVLPNSEHVRRWGGTRPVRLHARASCACRLRGRDAHARRARDALAREAAAADAHDGAGEEGHGGVGLCGGAGWKRKLKRILSHKATGEVVSGQESYAKSAISGISGGLCGCSML